MIDWQQIDTVFLDMDGTLLDLYFDNHFWQEFIPKCYAEKHKLSFADADKIMREKYQRVIGTMDWYCVDYWSKELSLDIEALKRETAHFIDIHPHAKEFLQRLHQSDKQTWLVTNAHQKSLGLKMEVTALDGYFNDIICSHDYKTPKEDPEFWELLQADKPYDPARTLLVEDSVSVLNSAKKYGIGHLLAITRPDSRQGTREIDDYLAVENFAEVLEGIPGKENLN